MESCVRELAAWLHQQRDETFRRMRRLPRPSDRASSRASRSERPPLHLVLTLAMPVVTTLVMLQFLPTVEAAQTSPRATSCPSGTTSYTIARGDTLFALAARYRTTI